MSDIGDIWYRYEDTSYAPAFDGSGDSRGESQIVVRLREYQVVRCTPKGVWLSMRFDDGQFCSLSRRFVLCGAHRRFACPNKKDAAISFRARKRKQISIYQARARAAQRALDALDRLFERDIEKTRIVEHARTHGVIS